MPYAADALSPRMSGETLEFHYGKHFQTYIDNLNRLVAGTGFEDMTLEELILKADGGIYNNAAQAWNHEFFFNGLSPVPSSVPSVLEDAINANFGSPDSFRDEFTQAAVSLFASGWVWLAVTPDGKLRIVSTPNAGNPMRDGLRPLLVVDVWEHAYYIDYRNRRADFISAWWDLVDWNVVGKRFQNA